MASKLPTDVHSERIVIDSALQQREAIFHDLPSEAFFSKDNQRAWETILTMDRDGKPVSFVSFLSEFPVADKGRFVDFGSGALPPETAYYHAGLVLDAWRKRKVIFAASQLSNALLAAQDTDTSLAEFESQIGTTNAAKTSHQFQDLLMPFFEDLEAKRNGDVATGLSTGFDALDQNVPLLPGDLMIVAGRPGMGKTSWAISTAVHVLTAGHSVFFASLEMPKEQIVSRIVGLRARVGSKGLRNGELASSDMTKISHAIPKLKEYRLFIDDRPALSSALIRAEATNVKRKHGLDLVIVDHIHLMKETGFRPGDEHAMFSEAVKGIKNLAKSLEVPVILLAQLNRGVEHRSPPIPKLSDLRETGTIEEMADTVMFLYRQDYYVEQGVIQQVDKDLIGCGLGMVSKNRHGPTMRCKMAWVPQYMSYENLERRY